MKYLLILFCFVGHSQMITGDRLDSFDNVPAPTLLPDMAGAAAYPNSSGEITGNWLDVSATYSQEGTNVHSGTTGIKVTGASNNQHTRSNSFLPAGYTTSKTYRLSGWYKWESGIAQYIRQYDATTGLTTTNLNTTGVWTYFENDHVAGQSTGYRLYLYSAGVYYFDDLELVELP